MANYPSGEHRKSLLQNCQRDLKRETLSVAPLTDDERWFWHGYDYGFRRVVLGDDAPRSPIDQDGQWFDARLANVAESFYRRKFNKSVVVDRAPPTAEDIAYVEAAYRVARANIDGFMRQSSRAFHSKARQPSLSDAQRSMGVKATEAIPRDPEAAEKAALWAAELEEAAE